MSTLKYIAIGGGLGLGAYLVYTQLQPQKPTLAGALGDLVAAVANLGKGKATAGTSSPPSSGGFLSWLTGNTNLDATAVASSPPGVPKLWTSDETPAFYSLATDDGDAAQSDALGRGQLSAPMPQQPFRYGDRVIGGGVNYSPYNVSPVRVYG